MPMDRAGDHLCCQIARPGKVDSLTLLDNTDSQDTCPHVFVPNRICLSLRTLVDRERRYVRHELSGPRASTP